jgi:YVTN family beta-propeller protein
MSKSRFGVILLLWFLIIIGCTPMAVPYKAPLENDGEVIIYLQPMPREAHRFRLGIEGISALRDDGVEVSLKVRMGELAGAELVGVQALVASGVLPEGSYRGISIRFSKASLRTAEGEADLAVSGEPVVVEQGFTVFRRKAIALSLNFQPPESVPEGLRFTPVFSLVPYGKQVTNLIGYVSNPDANLVTVFNKNSMHAVGAIATGMGPAGMALDQGRGRAYAALSGENAVLVMDVFTGEVVDRVALRGGDEPRELALTPDGRTLVTANYGSRTVSIIDTEARYEVERVGVGEGPVSVVVDPRGLRAYVLNSITGTLSVIDLSRRELAATVAVEESPVRGAFSREGDRLYIIASFSPDLLALDASTLAVAERIFVGKGAVSLKVDTRTSLIYVGKDSGEITIIDPLSLMFIDSFDSGGSADSITIDGEENSLLVLSSEAGTLRKFSLVGNKLTGELHVEKGACSVVVMGER